MLSIRGRADEIWASLEYISEIKEARNDFLRSKGIDGLILDEVGQAFRSYIVQARNFYSYAQDSDYRSAALLYYYSFLNLGKAKLLVSNPSWVSEEFHHGITSDVKTGDLSTLSSRVCQTRKNINVFNELYKLRFGKLLPTRTTIALEDLLAYATDVGTEFSRTTSKKTCISGVKYVIGVDTDRKKCWPKLAIHNWGVHEPHNTFKKFTNEFYKANASPISVREQFDINVRLSSWYTVFESEVDFDFLGKDTIDTLSCDALVKNTLKNCYQQELYDRDTGFEIVSPLPDGNFMDEMLAIYMTMHHLSEVVRYRPFQMENLLANTTKSGWLMKNFIEQAPLTCIYRFSCWLTGKTVHYQPR